MYALKIRKSDLPLLTILNGGVTPKIEKKTTWLIIDPNGTNEIVSERDLAKYDISTNGPLLLKLKK